MAKHASGTAKHTIEVIGIARVPMPKASAVAANTMDFAAEVFGCTKKPRQYWRGFQFSDGWSDQFIA